MQPETSRLKAQVAYYSRHDIGCPPEKLQALRLAYQAARLGEHIRRVVNESGPLTTEQAQFLAKILTESTQRAPGAAAA